MKPLLILLVTVALLPSCGPIPRVDAEKLCIDQARLAQHPRGEVGLGAGSGGLGGHFEMTVTSDYLLGRDPDAVYASCVHDRSGQQPTRPFSSLPQSRM